LPSLVLVLRADFHCLKLIHYYSSPFDSLFGLMNNQFAFAHFIGL